VPEYPAEAEKMIQAAFGDGSLQAVRVGAVQALLQPAVKKALEHETGRFIQENAGVFAASYFIPSEDVSVAE